MSCFLIPQCVDWHIFQNIGFSRCTKTITFCKQRHKGTKELFLINVPEVLEHNSHLLKFLFATVFKLQHKLFVRPFHCQKVASSHARLQQPVHLDTVRSQTEYKVLLWVAN